MAAKTKSLTRSRPGPRADVPGADPLLERIAWLMDNSIGIPGTRFRVGIDALLGLIPGAGDFLSAVVQAGLVILAVTRYNVPRPVAARMAANVLLDMGLGSIPLVGDLFDAGFKANTRNLRLLRQVHDRRLAGGQDRLDDLSSSSRNYLLAIGAALGIGLLLMLVGAIALVVWLVRLLSA